MTETTTATAETTTETPATPPVTSLFPTDESGMNIQTVSTADSVAKVEAPTALVSSPGGEVAPREKRLTREKTQEIEITEWESGIDLPPLIFVAKKGYAGHSIHVQATDEEMEAMEVREKWCLGQAKAYTDEATRWAREIEHNKYLQKRLKDLENPVKITKEPEVPVPVNDVPLAVIPASLKRKPGQRGPDKVPRKKRGSPKSN